MGADKASLEVGGEPLARRVARVLADACGSVVVASGDGRRLDWLGLPQVADVEPGAGPLGGIVAGLEAAMTPFVAVVAVDMPDASTAVLRLLAARAAEGHGAAVPRTDAGLQPLHAVYAARAADALRGAFEAGERSVRGAIERLDVVVVEPAEWSIADPTGGFARNLNRPADLDRT
jgi:molybdopterin-guanine dinucleotide biosynthesis protein A